MKRGESVESMWVHTQVKNTAAAVLLILLVVCAAPSSYMGIGFGPGAASPELQSLAQRAQARLDLGIAYEEGRGVALDRRKARSLYRLASAGDAF
jgi:TPR repeat protein